MKHLKLGIAMLVVFALLLVSCEKEELTNGNNSAMYEDFPLDLRHYFRPTELTVEPCEGISLKICIDDCFQTDWGTNITRNVARAINNYNALKNVNVTFELVLCTGDHDIEISCLTGENIFCNDGYVKGGEAMQIVDGDPNTNQIWINPLFEELVECCGDQFDDCSYTGVVMHELGHAIGLFHTNDHYSANSQEDIVFIEGTPLNDSTSLFNGGTLCERTCAFSEGDLTALQLLYPDATIEKTGDLCDKLYCINHDLADISWILPLAYAGATSPCIDLTGMATGEHILEADVTIGECTITISDTIEVMEPGCEIQSYPPSIFTTICFGDGPVCHDFSDYGCLVELEVYSSNPKVVAEANGTKICIESIFPYQENVTLQVIPHGICGDGQTQYWNITVNDPRNCRGNGWPK